MSQEAPHHHPPPFDVPSVEEMSAYLPQYKFEKLAAYGGMGAVFKARQESLDRPVAIKILPPEFGAEPEFAERFKSEARAMAKLNHTNIVAVYDFGITSGGHLYLVMEWVEGPTLHELIHKGSIPVRKVAHLGMQLCDALAYAHNHRILHRDIKPGNIMVNQDDQVKVADFGLARPITGEAEENPYGTPDYAAPEILAKQAVDQRADIFAAGVVIYEMLTGRVPKQPRRSVTEYSPVSPRWDELIDQATHPDTTRRFQDVLDLRASIMQVMTQAAAAAAPVAVAVVEAEPPRKHGGLKPLHLALVSAAVVVVLGISLGVVFKPEPEKPRKAKVAAGPKTTDDSQEKPRKARQRPEEPEVMPATPPAPTSAEPDPEKKKNRPGEAADDKKMAAASATPAPEPMPPPAAMPGSPLEDLQRLDERDPELAALVEAFGIEWSAHEGIDTEPKLRDLTDKYIPALQRSLPRLPPEQRDHILSEISHIANREPLNPPEPSWPPVLDSLRKTYDSQLATILADARSAADKLRAAQCELVLTKAKERLEKADAEGAKRAETLAAELAKLTEQPSLKALRQNIAAGSTAAATVDANSP